MHNRSNVCIESPYFELYFKFTGKGDALHPDVIEDLYRMQNYLDRQLIFHEATDKLGDEGEWARELNVRMQAYFHNGLLGYKQRNANHKRVGTIYNDGVNTYMYGKQVIPMSRDEYLTLYPQATVIF